MTNTQLGAADARNSPTGAVRGIGAVFAAQLAAAGIRSAYDLLWFVPRRYVDYRRVLSFGDLAAMPGVPPAAAVAARVFKSKVVRRPGASKNWIEAQFVIDEDATSPVRITARWFGMPTGFLQQLAVGQGMVLAGQMRRDGDDGTHIAMANPKIFKAGVVPGLVPVYGVVEGIAPGHLRRAIAACVAQFAHTLIDESPCEVLASVGLPTLREAFMMLHDPTAASEVQLSDEDARLLMTKQSKWHRRLLWSECFALGVRFAVERARLAAQTAPMLPVTKGLVAEIATAIPFVLTPGQTAALGDISRDLAQAVPMRRMLVGDVGSGKTAVAFAAMLQVVRAGHQVALLAPTEVLVAQHAATLAAWASPLGIEVATLSGAMTMQQQTSVLARLRGGTLQVIVGTHALLGKDVLFARLGLYIVDEQHRFGVAQRNLLGDKGGALQPHGLIMSATPIPRSLALTMYGELVPTFIRGRPAGREPPATELLVGQDECRAAWTRLAVRIDNGERGFVVCPAIEGGGTRASIVAMQRILAQRLPAARIAICHGQQSAPERQRAIAQLIAHDVDIVLATTVIEVGVDVPAATFMVIVDAEAFGLAALHQLRGRVGRGGGASSCHLMTRATAGDEALARLGQLITCHDGFALAEADLAARGPGAVLGVRQAGLWRLQFTDWLADVDWIAKAQAAAATLVQTAGTDLAPLLAHAREWFDDDALGVL